MENQSINKGVDWNCPKCESLNFGEDNFCKNCGYEKISEMAIVSLNGNKSKVKKVLLGIVVVLFVGVSSSGAYYVYYQNKLKKEAKQYLLSESKAFENSVNLINNISTEKNILESEADKENMELFIKKAESEKSKIERALSEIKITKDKNDQADSNKLVLGLDSLLVQYYQDSLKNISKYDEYLAFGIAVSKEEKKMDEESEKIAKIFDTAQSMDDVTKALGESIKFIENYLAVYKNIKEPEGYSEIKNKKVVLIEDMLRVFKDFHVALQEKNEAGVISAGNRIEEIMSDTKRGKDIVELEKYHFEQMHAGISGVRKSAEVIKTEMLKTSLILGVNLQEIEIESW